MSNLGIARITSASVSAILISGIWAPISLSNLQGQLRAEAGSQDKSDYQTFRSFLENAVGNPDYQVSYQVDMPGNPTETVEQWFKGNKFRMDTQVKGSKARIYRIGEEIANCISHSNNWRCFKLPNLNQVPASTVEGVHTLEDVKNNPETYRNRVAKAGTRVVAGEPATCFKIKELEQQESLLSCYSKNHGIPLYLEGNSQQGQWQMTATDFQTSVNDSAFALPAPPKTMPGMPGGFQMPSR